MHKRIFFISVIRYFYEVTTNIVLYLQNLYFYTIKRYSGKMKNFMIRKATYSDVPDLMAVFDNARSIMRDSGNMNQWNDNYPSEETVRKDISDEVCHVLCENGKIIATMAFIPGPDPTYTSIYDGKWLDDSPYYVIHRIAVAEPGHNAAAKLLEWGFSHTASIRIDTHKDNVIMHHILQKQGFTHCGVIYLMNGNPREAYQKNI